MFAAVTITGVAGVTAGEEEDRILALVLAHPVKRSTLVVAKGAAIAAGALILALATWVGLIAGVAAAGGGIGLGNLGALSLHLAFYGFASGAVALAARRRPRAAGRSPPEARPPSRSLGYLVNGFAPLVDPIAWLKYFSPFYYYAADDPLANGVDVGDLAVLGLFSAALTAVAVVAIRRRDLRA